MKKPDFSKLKKMLDRIPEFSSKALQIAVYVSLSILALTGGFLIFEMVTTPDWTFDVEWNMFKSILLWPLYIIGLVIAIAHIGKNHYSQDTIIETTYSDGSKTREKSNDITDFMFGHFLIPLLMHFVIEPLMWAAVIYYPIMCVFALISSVLPYVLSLLIIGGCVGLWFYPKYCTFRYHSLVLVAGTLLLATIFVFGGLNLMSL